MSEPLMRGAAAPAGKEAAPSRVLRFLLFLVLSAAAAATILAGDPQKVHLLRLAVLLILFGLIRYFFLKRIPSPTPSGAIVMAIGIFINGAIRTFPLLADHASGFAVALAVVLLFVAWSYLKDAWRGELVKKHFTNPVGTFGAGTWVAGISVCSIAVVQRVPEWTPVVQAVVVANAILWLFFIIRAANGFLKILAPEMAGKPHGVLLLSTVSTQSLVIVAKVAFGSPAWYPFFARLFITLGALFYFACLALIFRRYATEGKGFDLDKSWFNTNCIIHGAMSITGLASAVSGVVPPNLVLAIWLWVLFWIVVVEMVEVARALVRVSRLGFSVGLGAYDPTQWSRNFTFGMFYAFTLNFNITASSAGPLLSALRTFLLDYFGWVVLLVLVAEIAVFLADRYRLPQHSAPAAL